MCPAVISDSEDEQHDVQVNIKTPLRKKPWAVLSSPDSDSDAGPPVVVGKVKADSADEMFKAFEENLAIQLEPGAGSVKSVDIESVDKSAVMAHVVKRVEANPVATRPSMSPPTIALPPRPPAKIEDPSSAKAVSSTGPRLKPPVAPLIPKTKAQLENALRVPRKPMAKPMAKPMHQNISEAKRSLASPRRPEARQFDAQKGAFSMPMTPRQTDRKASGPSLKQAVAVLDDAEIGLLYEPKEARIWGRPQNTGLALQKMNSPSKVSESPMRLNTPSPVKAGRLGYVAEDKANDQLKSFINALDGSTVDGPEVTADVEGLKVKLLDHQVVGLKFLLSRELTDTEGHCKGGFLCDDMGLGKTVQTMAVILSNRKKQHDTNDAASKTSKTLFKSGATLVVAPVSLVSQWAQELKTKAPGLKVWVHHGANRTDSWRELTNHDVVVTTYHVVASEHSTKGIASKSPLFQAEWWRVVLDEAHTIKNRKTKTAAACCDLIAVHRWCLTGTPIQNSAEELYSLFQFLRLAPYNNWSRFDTQIGRPLKAGQGELAMTRLHVLLQVAMLRRTKNVLEGQGMALPQKHVHRQMLQFTAIEKDVYQSLEHRMHKRVGDLLVDGGGGFMHALVLLLRLRQVCNHMSLACMALSGDDKESTAASVSGASTADELSDMLSGLDLDNDADKELDLTRLAQSHSGVFSTEFVSTKIQRLLDLFAAEPDRKTIVFSQFTSFFDILEPFLRNHDVNYVRYDGSMNRVKRDRSLSALKDDSSVGVLLCSLKSGAVGLNLVAASRVVLVDPWWNPMIAAQAVDRVHRIGQTHEVDVYELIVEGTVEEKILELQDRKRALASGILGNNKVLAGDKMDSRQLLSLFT